MRISSRDFGGLYDEDAGIAHHHPSWVFAEEWVIKGSNVLVRQASSMPTTLSCPELSLSPPIIPPKGHACSIKVSSTNSSMDQGQRNQTYPLPSRMRTLPWISRLSTLWL
jgi:hypothetical protein